MSERVVRDREAFERLPVGVFTIGDDGKIDWVSANWYAETGMIPADTLGEAWIFVLHPDDVEATVWRWTVAMETGEPFVATVRTRVADGSYRWYLSQARLVRDENDEPYWLGTTQDLTLVAPDRLASIHDE